MMAASNLAKLRDPDMTATDSHQSHRVRPYASRLPHICFVAPYTWPVFSGDPDIPVVGGAEVQQSILARLFSRAGYKVSMICVDYGQADGQEFDGVTVYKTYRPNSGLPVMRFLYPRLTSTWQALQRADADIYYQRSSAMLTGVVAEFCRRHGRRSIFAGASDADFIPGKQPIKYARDRWLFERGLARVDRIVVQNANQKQDCRANYGRESVLIPSCYQIPSDARPGTGGIVLWVGTIRDYKRPELFLEMARKLPQHQFVMVGGPGPDVDGGYFEGIRRDAASLSNLEFTGFLPLHKVEPYFDRAKVFVNTSVYEGVPNTFMQAWARGVPTVATVDVAARWGNEPLYRVIGTVDEGVEEIDRLLLDEEYRTRISSRCLQHFSGTHASSAVLAHYGKVFEELMQGRES